MTQSTSSPLPPLCGLGQWKGGTRFVCIAPRPHQPGRHYFVSEATAAAEAKTGPRA